MHIECENCNKKFELDSNLIPENGRELQCGSCEHIWFFKKKINIIEKNEIIEDQNINIEKEQIKKKIKKVKKELHEDEKHKKEYNIDQKVEKKDYNILKIFLVLIITFIAIIIVLDTFKSQLSFIYPNLDNLLNNLYQSITDVVLFFKDLIK
tara:strand:+ start:137 stop:592 length:456 start_codon:yes stop_codon:yes gene_type:complete